MIPKVEIRFHNLKVVADVQVGSRTLPTLINYSYDVIEVYFFPNLIFFLILI